MNTQTVLNNSKHQAPFTLFCVFPENQKYFGQHKKFTFRGDQFGNNEKEMLNGLNQHFFSLYNEYKIPIAYLYDNRPYTQVPERVVGKYVNGRKRIWNEMLVYTNPFENHVFREGFINYMIHQAAIGNITIF